MIIVRFQGGLGNQMFQYALYKKIKHMNCDSVVKVDVTSYRTQLPHNGYELEKVFCIDDLDFASDREIFDCSGLKPYIGVGGDFIVSEKIKDRIVRKIISSVNLYIDKKNKKQ